MRTHPLAIIAMVAAQVLLSGCGPTAPAGPAFTDSDLAIFKVEPVPPASDNPVTLAKVELGKALYHDKRLSRDGTVACSNCHELARFGVDGKPVSEGVAGQKGGRNAPTSLNAAWHFVQFWDGRASTIEDQAIGPVLNPIEHGLADEAELIAKLLGDPATVAGFQKAFPQDAQPVSAVNFQRAVGAFERTLRTRSRFDDFLAGKVDALTVDERNGLRTFIDVGCTTCHMGRLLGGGMFQKLGLLKPYETKDQGRFEHTRQESDRGFFKVPSLLNVAETGPWFHDGSVSSLDQAVKLMARHQRGVELSPGDVQAVVTFLRALTGEVDPQAMPKQ